MNLVVVSSWVLNNTVILPILFYHVNSVVTGLLSQQPCNSLWYFYACIGGDITVYFYVVMWSYRLQFTGQDRTQSKHGVSKRFRTTFSAPQLNRLESEFCQSMYVVGLKRMRLAVELNLEEKQIKIWFQNRRMKHKRQLRNNERKTAQIPYYHCYQWIFIIYQTRTELGSIWFDEILPRGIIIRRICRAEGL